MYINNDDKPEERFLHLPPAVPWDPVKFTATRSDDPALAFEYINQEHKLLKEEVHKATPESFTIVTIVSLDKQFAPGITNPIATNVYTTTRAPGTGWYTPSELECELEHCSAASYSEVDPRFKSRFRDNSRYISTIAFYLSTITCDAAMASIEQRPMISQPEKANALLANAFRMFTGIVCVGHLYIDNAVALHEVVPLGVRPDFQN